MKKSISLIGYSGHAYVIINAIHSTGNSINGYYETNEKSRNPFRLKYLGRDKKVHLKDKIWFICIGNNTIRRKLYEKYNGFGEVETIKHNTSFLGAKTKIGQGTFVSAMASINALATIGLCCIVNTSAVIEHECSIADFVHIGPGAVLAGNVSVGENTLIGANAVVKQGIKIGSNVIIGAGAVVIKNVPSDKKVVGNPARYL